MTAISFGKLFKMDSTELADQVRVLQSLVQSLTANQEKLQIALASKIGRSLDGVATIDSGDTCKTF